MTTYRTFKRTCRNWREFATARKMTVNTGLTYEQARNECEEFNRNLTAAQKRRGTRLEFTEEV